MAGEMDTRASVEALFQLARDRARAGDDAGAARTWDAAVGLAEGAGLEEIVAIAEAGLAQVDVRERRLEVAHARLASAWARCGRPGVPAAVRAQVGGQLGQVLVFLGRPAEGASLMHGAVRDWQAAGESTAAHELELALSAVCERVDRAVDEAASAPAESRAAALCRRAQVALATDDAERAVRDLAAAWDLARPLDPRPRGRVGALYGQLLAARGAPDALPVLLAARQAWEAVGERGWIQRVDALIAGAAGAAEA